MKRRRQIPIEEQSEPTTGSPVLGGPVYLAIGKLRRSHGIHGDMVMEVLTDFPDRIRVGKFVYVGENHDAREIVSSRSHDRMLIIRFSGIDTPEDAGLMRNQNVYVKAAELPKLPQGEYYHHQLLGLSIVDENGQKLGELKEILETGANDVYVVKFPEGKELLLPALDDVILGVDLERGEMIVRPPEWL